MVKGFFELEILAEHVLKSQLALFFPSFLLTLPQLLESLFVVLLDFLLKVELEERNPHVLGSVVFKSPVSTQK